MTVIGKNDPEFPNTVAAQVSLTPSANAARTAGNGGAVTLTGQVQSLPRRSPAVNPALRGHDIRRFCGGRSR